MSFFLLCESPALVCGAGDSHASSVKRCGVATGHRHRLASQDRAAHFEDQGVVAMELIAAIAMFAVVLVIVGVALDAAPRAK
jgi:hypothetical protein